MKSGAVKVEVKTEDPKEKDSIGELYSVMDDICNINSETVEELSQRILKLGIRLRNVTVFILYIWKRRPKIREDLSKLLTLLSKKNNSFNNVLYSRKKQQHMKYHKTMTYPSTEIGQSIYDDDVNLFSQIISKPDFDPNKAIDVSYKEAILLIVPRDKVTVMKYIAFYGAYKCFKYAMNTGMFNYDNISKCAIAGGNINIILDLINKNVSFDNCYKTCIQYHRKNLVPLLKKKFKLENITIVDAIKAFDVKLAFLTYHKDKEGQKKYVAEALMEAVKREDVISCNWLIIDGNANCNEKYYTENYAKTTPDFTTVIHEAARNGSLDIIELFLRKSPGSVNFKDNYSKTPLHVAVENFQSEMMQRLVRKFHADCNIRDSSGKTPLFEAAKIKDHRFAKLLIEEGHADVNVEDRKGNVPLYDMYLKGNFDYIKTLFERGIANPRFKSKTKRNVFTAASWDGNIDDMNYLKDVLHMEPCLSDAALINARDFRKFDVGRYICKIDPYMKGTLENRALRNAIVEKDLPMIKFYIEDCGISVHTVAKTTMDKVLKSKDKEIVKYLKDHWY